MSYLREVSRVNEAKTCTVSGCDRPRKGAYRYHCERHARARNLYGSPIGKRIRRTAYVTERKMATHLVETNRQHPAIAEALKLARGWRDGFKHYDLPVRHHEAWSVLSDKLVVNNVSGETLLIEMVAAFAYMMLRPNEHGLTSQEANEKFMGSALLNVVPRGKYLTESNRLRSKRVSGRVRQLVGAAALSEFGLFLSHATAQLEQQATARTDRRINFTRPFSQPQKEALAHD